MKRIRSLFPAVKAGVFIFIALVLFLSACAPTVVQTEQSPAEPEAIEEHTAPTQEETVPTQEPTATSEPVYVPKEFTDALGREVTIETPPMRIVSLAPSVTELLFAIGAGPQVVGRTEYCNYPPEVETLPTIGGFAASSISIEVILDLEPDLVIGGSTLQEEVIEVLETAGITAFVVQPSSVAEIMDTLLLLGNVTNQQDIAVTLIDEMQVRIDALSEIAAAIPEEESLRVFYEVWHEPLMTTTSQTFVGELIELAGGINIFGDLEDEYPAVSAEQILELDPQVILGPSSHGDQLTVEMIATREGWANLTAIQNKAVFIIDGDVISRPGPRIVDALEMIASALYPDHFSE